MKCNVLIIVLLFVTCTASTILNEYDVRQEKDLFIKKERVEDDTVVWDSISVYLQKERKWVEEYKLKNVLSLEGEEWGISYLSQNMPNLRDSIVSVFYHSLSQETSSKLSACTGRFIMSAMIDDKGKMTIYSMRFRLADCDDVIASKDVYDIVRGLKSRLDFEIPGDISKELKYVSFGMTISMKELRKIYEQENSNYAR